MESLQTSSYVSTGEAVVNRKPIHQQTTRSIVIKPSKGWVSFDFGELWRYRDLFFFFVWRDIKVRYRQTIMGVAWAIIQPVLTMVIFSFVFGRLAKIDSDGLPYPIFNYAALVPWTFFATAVTLASNVLVQNANMVKKIYFPRLVMPAATVLSVLVDFALAFVVLLGMMYYYGFAPTANAVWLPVFVLLTLVAALGVSLWLAAMNVQFRDVRYVVPFLIQAWLFITPVVYSSSLLSDFWRTVYGLNPMASVVEGFRWALLGTGTAPGLMLVVSTCMALAVFISGAFYFRRMEKSFADLV
jgi:lipopolysaccharide transport system permease protein